MPPIDIVKLYFSLSNSRNLDMIEPLFAPDAVYSSDTTGLYHGRDAIMNMMRGFFDKFHFLSWEIINIAEQDEGIIEVEFQAIFQNDAQEIHKTGKEIIVVKDSNIISIEVKTLS